MMPLDHTKSLAHWRHQAACSNNRGKWNFYNIWRAECTCHDTLQSFAWKLSRRHQQLIWLQQQPAFSRAFVSLVKSTHNKLRQNRSLLPSIIALLR